MKQTKFYKYWEIIATILAWIWIVTFFLSMIFGYRFWLADGDTKCALSQAPATCAAVKAK